MSEVGDETKRRKPVEWSYDDPESCARAWEAAMNDPEFVAESMRVYRDFECTMADGLDDDDWSEYLREDGTLNTDLAAEA